MLGSWVQVPSSPLKDNTDDFSINRCDNDVSFHAHPYYIVLCFISYKLSTIGLTNYLYYLFIVIWCNGSTKDFGSFSSGSNPGMTTNPFVY